MIGSAYTPLTDFFLALSIAAFGVEAWAFIDAITRPANAFVASGKQTKKLWLIILGVATVVGLAGAVYRMARRRSCRWRRSWPPPSTWPTSGPR